MGQHIDERRAAMDRVLVQLGHLSDDDIERVAKYAEALRESFG